MMMGYGWGMGAGGWIAMTVFWVALIVLAVWLGRRALSDSSDRGPGFRGDDGGWRETPEQTLDRRFASGEIDEATFHQMRGTLRSSRSSGPTEG